MRQRSKKLGVVLMGVACASSLMAATLDYQGRITAQGEDVTGPGFFKFVLHDGNGNAWWSNDGTKGMTQPKKAVSVVVKGGLFDVQLGDEKVGMRRIQPLAFHAPALQLRTWFSQKKNGPFEALQPDVTIHPLDLAHFNTGNLIVVDDDGGGGDFQDLQQAVNVAAANPAFNAVLVMPGRYRLSKPLSVPAGARILVKGLAAEWVTVEAAQGAALVPFDGVIEGLTLKGNPAIDDAGAKGATVFTVRGCTLSGLAGGEAVRISRAAGSVRIAQSSIEGAPGIALGEQGVPEVLNCRINAPKGRPTVGLIKGATKGSIRMMDTILSADLAQGVTLLAPARELPFGNVVLSD